MHQITPLSAGETRHTFILGHRYFQGVSVGAGHGPKSIGNWPCFMLPLSHRTKLFSKPQGKHSGTKKFGPHQHTNGWKRCWLRVCSPRRMTSVIYWIRRDWIFQWFFFLKRLPPSQPPPPVKGEARLRGHPSPSEGEGFPLCLVRSGGRSASPGWADAMGRQGAANPGLSSPPVSATGSWAQM